MNKEKPGKEIIVTVIRHGDIMEGFQGVAWDFSANKNANSENYTFVKFDKKIVGPRDDLMKDSNSNYYIALRASGRCFAYLSDGIRVDPDGYTEENKRKIAS